MILNISHERTKETITVEYINNNCGISTQRTWLRLTAHSFVAMIKASCTNRYQSFSKNYTRSATLHSGIICRETSLARCITNTHNNTHNYVCVCV